MSEYFQTVKSYLQDLNLVIEEEEEAEELVVISDEDRGIHRLIIDCEDPILILHGAFAIDSETGTVLFRDTLRLDTLDRSELEGSINALELAMAENASELLEYSKQ
jgi:hypothetical protein